MPSSFSRIASDERSPRISLQTLLDAPKEGPTEAGGATTEPSSLEGAFFARESSLAPEEGSLVAPLTLLRELRDSTQNVLSGSVRLWTAM